MTPVQTGQTAKGSASGDPKAQSPVRPTPKVDPTLTGITVFPVERVVPRPGLPQRILVTARYSDGTLRDVTALARYQSQDDAVAGVDDQGRVTAKQPGESAIMVSYGGEVKIANIVVPQVVALGARSTTAPHRQNVRSILGFHPAREGLRPPAPPSLMATIHRQGEGGASPAPTGRSYVDVLVDRKLAQLRVPESRRATDLEFLRRVYLDTIATLPTPEETKAFMLDHDPDRRAKLIDRLLERPEYVDYRTLRLADMLRVNGQYLSEEGADVYYRWIHDQVQKNVPYDRFVRDLLTGRGSTFHVGPANYYRVAEDPDQLAETTAQSFLGVRLQCARCHNHPFERWKQSDYYGMAAFFARVGRKYGPEFGEEQVVCKHDGDARNPRSREVVPAKFLGGSAPKIEDDADRRAVLAGWLASKDNPAFARVAVNRIWADYFGRGIVEPVDDFRVSNPPANGPLLEALATDFIAHDFDVKYITRVLLTSDAYQRSSEILPGNAKDDRHFARAYPRRLPAEPLLDAIASVTEKPERFGHYPAGWRAIQVRDSQIGSYFLQVFGRPKREILCACERSEGANLSQSLHLINSGDLNGKLSAGDGRIAHLIKKYEKLDPAIANGRIIDAFYLVTLCRYPTSAETRTMLKHIDAAKDRLKGLEDDLWALLNSEEFLFNH